MLFSFQLNVLHAVDGGTPTESVPQRCRTTGVVGVVVGVAASAIVAVVATVGG